MWSDEIKAMRTAAKQTQAQAAEFLRVSKRSIESWETGKREPKEHTKNGIREIYNFYYGEHPERAGAAASTGAGAGHTTGNTRNNTKKSRVLGNSIENNRKSD